jgi:Kinase binding protein CGI-121
MSASSKQYQLRSHPQGIPQFHDNIMNRMLQVIHLCHLPPTLPLYLTLYHSVQNAPFLRQQLLAGNTDFEYAFVDASMVLLLFIATSTSHPKLLHTLTPLAVLR